MTTIIETKPLRLRCYTPDDADAMYGIFADPYARRFYPEMVDPAKVAD